MTNYNFTQEDINKIERFIEIKNKGYYCDGTQLTEVYNRVLNKRANVTNCGSCLRQRVSELEGALNHFKASEAKKQEELASIKAKENKAVTEPINDVKERMQKVRAARKNSKK